MLHLSTLDVIVEGAVLLPVLSEKPESVVVPKVFKLDQRVLPVFVHHGLHELVDQVIVHLRAIPLLIQAHVEGILQESLVAAHGTNTTRLMSHTLPLKETHSNSASLLVGSYLVVCADVYHHGEALLRSNSRAGCVQAQFTNRNAHSENTQVSQS